MPQANDLSRCLTALDQDSTLIAVIEMSQSSWLVAAIVPGIERHPAKKLEPDPAALLRLLQPHGTSPWAEGPRDAPERSAGALSGGAAKGAPDPGGEASPRQALAAWKTAWKSDPALGVISIE